MTLAQNVTPAQSHEHTHWSLFMTLAQAVMPVQNHEHTHIILLKIILAGPHVLLSLAWQS